MTALDRLDAEYENLQAALNFSAALTPPASKELRLTGALAWYWEMRGQLSEGQRRLGAALDPTGDPAAPPAVQAKALVGRGQSAYRLGEYTTARYVLLKALRHCVHSDQLWLRARALDRLGAAFREETQYERALEKYEEALAIWKEISDGEGTARTLNGLGIVYGDTNEFDIARRCFADAIKLAKGLQKPFLLVGPLNNLGILERNLGIREENPKRFEEARRLHVESLKKATGKWSRALIQYNLGIVFWLQGHQTEAWQCQQESLRMLSMVGDKAAGSPWPWRGRREYGKPAATASAPLNLFHAAQKLRDEINCPTEPNERGHLETSLRAAEKHIGRKGVVRCPQTGESMAN